MIYELTFYVIAAVIVIIVGISKGGFGGGLGLIAVPVLSLFIDPRIAAAILLPILCAMDVASLTKFSKAWHKQSLLHLIPGALIGTLLGALTYSITNADMIRLIIGLLSLYFVAYYLWGKAYLENVNSRKKDKTTAHPIKGTIWGMLSGFSSYVAHAGGPPVAIYLLPQRLSKTVFASTTIAFFSLINFIKLIPYLWLGQINAETFMSSLLLIPLAPLGVLIGVYLHHRVSDRLFYLVTCLFLGLTGIKLTYQGLSALL